MGKAFASKAFKDPSSNGKHHIKSWAGMYIPDMRIFGVCGQVGWGSGRIPGVCGQAA